MRWILTACLIGGAILWAMSAKADGDWSPENIVKVCNGGTECIQALSQMRAQSMAEQARMEQRQQERELAREQSRGLALFGSGNALIQGMNQGFQGMRLPPYHQPGASRNE